MDEKKQIEEIDELTTVLYEANHKKSVLDYRWLATEVYNANFRKQSRGEWKQAYNSFPRYVCTNCNHLFNNKTFKYCPNCGAKMKGGAE